MNVDQEEVFNRFVFLAKENYKKLNTREVKSANKIFEILYKECGAKLRSFPDQGERILMRLATHEVPAVRLHASYLLLPINEFTAMSTLSELYKMKIPWVSSSAKTTLDEWKRGTLDVNWFMKVG